MRHDLRVTVRAAMILLPVVVVAAAGLWAMPSSLTVRVTLITAVLLWSGYGLLGLQAYVLAPLRTAAGLLQGLREGNYSVRARGGEGRDGLGQLLGEVNALADWLQRQRLTEVEANALLITVMAELDAAVLAFDGRQALQLANPAAARLFGRPVASLLGQSAEALGCAALLEPLPARLVSLDFPSVSGRWEVRHSSFRQDGLSHDLVVLNEVSRALREEERQAWRRLIRVLSHELNNSLTPITSIANSLAQFVDRGPLDDSVRADVRKGLGVIEMRADSLNRFLRGYATLAKLPPPTMGAVDVEAVVRRVMALEAYPRLEIAGGPPCLIRADGDQIEQLLINLVRNGVDAARPIDGRVVVAWDLDEESEVVEIRVLDEGVGVQVGADVFVPFFTTKLGGTGIGLALCRQIADAHSGQVALENRTDRAGCLARVRLPTAAARPPPRN